MGVCLYPLYLRVSPETFEFSSFPRKIRLVVVFCPLLFNTILITT